MFLGEGGFSEVFFVKDRNAKKPRYLAVKIFKKKFSEAEKQINKEIFILHQCKHRNIIQYKESYLWNNIVWVVMEYCSGGSLKQLISAVTLAEKHIAYFAKEVFLFSFLFSFHYLFT